MNCVHILCDIKIIHVSCPLHVNSLHTQQDEAERAEERMIPVCYNRIDAPKTEGRGERFVCGRIKEGDR